MTSDEQESHSIRYVHGFWVVPLSSGALGVYTHPAGDFLGIALDFPAALTLWNERPIIIRSEPSIDIDLSDVEL